MGGGELFQRIQEKQAFNERGKKFEYNILLLKTKNELKGGPQIKARNYHLVAFSIDFD